MKGKERGEKKRRRRGSGKGTQELRCQRGEINARNANHVHHLCDFPPLFKEYSGFKEEEGTRAEGRSCRHCQKRNKKLRQANPSFVYVDTDSLLAFNNFRENRPKSWLMGKWCKIRATSLIGEEEAVRWREEEKRRHGKREKEKRRIKGGAARERRKREGEEEVRWRENEKREGERRGAQAERGRWSRERDRGRRKGRAWQRRRGRREKEKRRRVNAH